MSMTWNCRKDDCFVIECVRDAAEASGMNPDTAKFSDFPTHTQSAILRKAQELKAEYHENTEVVR